MYRKLIGAINMIRRNKINHNFILNDGYKDKNNLNYDIIRE